MATVEPGLSAVYVKIEEARGLAAAGRYPEARRGFEGVLAHIARASKGMEDTVLRGRWQDCARALSEELLLVAACEDECAALRLGDAREAPAVAFTAAPPQQPQQRGLAFDLDLQSNRMTPREGPGACGSGGGRGQSDPDEQADPLKWRPPSPMPRSLSTPSSPAHARRPSDRAPGATRHARHASYNNPNAGKPGAAPGAAAAPKVNCWRTPPVGRRPADPKSTILDQVISRFGTAEQELVEQLGKDMMDTAPGVHWSDIAGLKAAKQVLVEHVSVPLSMPQLFKGKLLRPCKGVLLFGPPGTGKTMLAKAVATECRTTFFNVSTSTLASKFRGESEKLVRMLFEMARAAAPSVIFVDEIDSVCSARGGQSEHEASRRMKTELLTQVDGMHTGGGEEPPRVMVLAATNFPWDIDEALRRRLEKRIYIPLPSASERVELLNLCLKDARLAGDVSLEAIAGRTEGFSGDDISNMCRDAAFNVVRRQMLGRSLSTPEKMQQLQEDLVDNIVIGAADFEYALGRIRPSCSTEDIARHEAFANTYGAT